MSARNRQPRGRALGALAGTYPEPALGLPNAMGPAMLEECLRDYTITASIGATYGDLCWAASTLGGVAATFSFPSATAAGEIGLLRATTSTTSGSGMVLTIGGGATVPVFLAPGMIWASKLRMVTGTSLYELWSGFLVGGRINTAASALFVGVRSEGGNLFGVAKNGAGAGNETTIDLGIDCESSTWRTSGFEYTEDGIQFFTLQSDEYTIERTDVGDPITTNIPTAGLAPLLFGLVTTTPSARAADVDWWNLGGRIAR